MKDEQCAECIEQARLLDMSATREARLKTTRAELLVMLAEAHEIIDAIGQPETADVAARMREVIARATGKTP